MEPTQSPFYVNPAPVVPPPVHPQPKKTGFKLPKKRWLILGALVVLLLAAIGFGIFAFLTMQQQKDNELAAAEVTITAEGFNATTTLVKKGTELTWVNKDEQPHKITSDSESISLDSGEALANGDSYTHTFDQIGTYSYYDPLNIEGFKGVVIVE